MARAMAPERTTSKITLVMQCQEAKYLHVVLREGGKPCTHLYGSTPSNLGRRRLTRRHKKFKQVLVLLSAKRRDLWRITSLMPGTMLWLQSVSSRVKRQPIQPTRWLRTESSSI